MLLAGGRVLSTVLASEELTPLSQRILGMHRQEDSSLCALLRVASGKKGGSAERPREGNR